MTTAVDTDIDAFIREQKLKLASERQAMHRERQYQRNTLENLKKQERELREELDKNEHYPGVKRRPDSDLLYRQEWAKKHPESNGFNQSAAEVTPHKTKGKLDGGISSPDYRHRWQEVHGNKQQPSKEMAPRGESIPQVTKLTQRDAHSGNRSNQLGQHKREFDLEAPIRRAEKHLEEEDYIDEQNRQGFEQSSEKHTRRKWDAPVAPVNGSMLLRDLDADQQKPKQPRRPDHSTWLESQRDGSRTQQEPSEEMSGLPLGEYEEKRKTYNAQRRQEYNEMIRKDQERRQREELDNTFGFMGLGDHQQLHPSAKQNDVQGAGDRWQTSGTRKGHPDSIPGNRAQIDSIRDLLRWDSGADRVGLTSADLVNQALRDERRREYNMQLEQEDRKRHKKMQQREAQHQQDTFSFQEGDRQEKWSEEREQEYRQMLTGKSREERRQEEEAIQQAGSATQNGAMDVSRKPFQDAEGRQELSIISQSQQNCGFARERYAGTPSDESSFLSNLGSRYENERRRLREERQNEYKAMLQEKVRSRQEPVNQSVVSEKAVGSAIRPNSSALRMRQREERNREYNTMLNQKWKQNDGQKYGSIFKENFEDNFLSSLGSGDVRRK